MNSNHDKLQRLKQQRAKIDARIQKTEARHKTMERKQDARRKILIGAYYLDRAHQEDKYDQLLHQMDVFLTRNSDRKLFGLSATIADDRENLENSSVIQ